MKSKNLTVYSVLSLTLSDFPVNVFLLAIGGPHRQVSHLFYITSWDTTDEIIKLKLIFEYIF